jgi:hypothetical protein
VTSSASAGRHAGCVPGSRRIRMQPWLVIGDFSFFGIFRRPMRMIAAHYLVVLLAHERTSPIPRRFEGRLILLVDC